ncbi:MAG: hypothetical protein IKA68_03310 [Clostridia bacterium]|nr:hypothetical protein [Clostridia bacterium]
MSNTTAKHVMSTEFSVGALIWNGIIGTIVVNILLGILVGICWVTVILIPLGIFFGFLAVANTIGAFFTIIGMIRCKGHLTEEGVYGRKSVFGSFDVTFDKVVSISRRKKNLTIVALDENGKKKKYNLTAVKNAKDFEQAFNQTMLAYRSAGAQAPAEAPAAE